MPRTPRLWALHEGRDSPVLERVPEHKWRNENGRVVREPETYWLKVPSGEWMVAYRLEPGAAGGLQVVEAKMYPRTSVGVRPDRWHIANFGGPAGKIPRGGMTSRAVRESMKPAEAEAIARRILRTAKTALGDEFFGSVFPSIAPRAMRTVRRGNQPGPKGRSDEELALIAREYVRAIDAGKPPAREIASFLHVSRYTARQVVGRCRARGLLTYPDTPRKADGKLTPYCEEILRRIERRESKG